MRFRLLPVSLLTCVLLGASVHVASAQGPAETDFLLVNLPTTLQLPSHKSNFRLTHRFQSNLEQGPLSRQASNLFGLDSGAAIGFEYRYAVARRVQAGAYRTNVDRATQFSAKLDAITEGGAMPVSVSAIVSVEGRNNFRRDYAPALGVAISRRLPHQSALYANPVWVHNSAAGSGSSRETVMLGLGGRVRLHGSVYVVAEVAPRLGGYAPGDAEYAVAVEKRAGRHVFQMNVSNTVGTTQLQTAQGGFPGGLFLGFNLARKFF